MVEDNDDQNQADGGLQNLIDAPALVPEDREAHKQGNGRRGQLLEHCHGERGSGAAHVQVGLNLLLEDVDVVLKFPREKFADLLIDAVHVGGQRQQAQQRDQRECDAPIHAVLRLAPGARSLRSSRLETLPARDCSLSISPASNFSCRRKRLSLRAISPLSRS